jgi:hypothetical protein
MRELFKESPCEAPAARRRMIEIEAGLRNFVEKKK